METAELIPIVRDLSVIGCLVIAVRWLADKFSAAQRELVDLLRGVISDNTKTLGEVRDSMRKCHQHRENVSLHEPKENRP